MRGCSADRAGLGRSQAWAGYLNSAYGVGAVLAATVSVILVGRRLGAPILGAALLTSAVLAALGFGAGLAGTVALLALAGADSPEPTIPRCRPRAGTGAGPDDSGPSSTPHHAAPWQEWDSRTTRTTLSHPAACSGGTKARRAIRVR